jgi:metallo-beta-lactamase family protein
MKLTFKGAIDAVTGSRTLVEYDRTSFLIDAGLYQGEKSKRLLNWEPQIPIEMLDFIFLTHAHIDHSGLLPKLAKDGFNKPIYCSHGTKDLAEILLLDSAGLQEEDAKYANETGYSHHKPALPLYNRDDAQKALNLFHAINQNEWFSPRPDLSFRLTRSGHIIGSSFIEILYRKSTGTSKITFSGDIGNGRSSILRPPLNILETDFLVLESTYGDRLQSRTDTKEELAAIINKIIQRGGVALIPAFAVGRAQEVLNTIAKLKKQNLIDAKIPVYLDSPMSSKATDIFLKHQEEHLGEMEFVGHFTSTPQGLDSRVLQENKSPMIIISASGMLTGGRIMHHLKLRLPDEKNGLIFVGYQAESTKGRLLQNGLKELRIHHESIPVNAEIFTIDSLSAHADYLDIFEWLKNFQKKPKKIFLNHGETASRASLGQKLKELGYDVELPEINKTITI